MQWENADNVVLTEQRKLKLLVQLRASCLNDTYIKGNKLRKNTLKSKLQGHPGGSAT